MHKYILVHACMSIYMYMYIYREKRTCSVHNSDYFKVLYLLGYDSIEYSFYTKVFFLICRSFILFLASFFPPAIADGLSLESEKQPVSFKSSRLFSVSILVELRNVGGMVSTRPPISNKPFRNYYYYYYYHYGFFT